MRTYRLVIGPKDARQRLDRYLVQHLPKTLSRAAIQRAIEAGHVTVETHPAKPHRLLKPGETVLARLEALPQPSTGAIIRPEPIPLEVVYEDGQLLVVNKPAGLVTHPAPGHWSGTLVNAIAWYLKTDGGLPRMGIVHRLDKDTSGLLVVAKTDVALTMLARQLKDRTMSRRYLALVDGHVALNEGTVDAAIGRHHKDRKLMAVRYLGGRQAVTHYRVLKRFAGKFPYTVLDVWLETGRTHQIRVHVAHLGHPVLGDTVYGHHPAGYWRAHGIARQLLHATAIRFLHPTTQKPVALTIGAPEDMMKWLG